MNTIPNDHAYMADALRLARKGLYTTRTNPRVGCVIVKQNQIIGRGYHTSPGHAHAEINALQEAGGDAAQSNVYVTLEPCSHYGKTSPCVNSLVDAKVKHVIAAMQDPNPEVNGRGLHYLRENGISTTCDILADEAAELNKGFIQRMTMNRPYVTIKTAISLDGKTALQSGESKWISGEASRGDVHKLRARSCAIMTGIDTVLADDPRLTARISEHDLGAVENFKQPKRVILDTNLRIPGNANALKNSSDVIIYTNCKDKKKRNLFDKLSIEVITVEKMHDHLNLNEIMNNLANHGFNEVLVEAGPTLSGNLLQQKLVDEWVVYMAPHILGDAARSLIHLPVIQSMQERLSFNLKQIRQIGEDVKLILKPTN